MPLVYFESGRQQKGEEDLRIFYCRKNAIQVFLLVFPHCEFHRKIYVPYEVSRLFVLFEKLRNPLLSQHLSNSSKIHLCKPYPKIFLPLSFLILQVL